MIKMMEKEQKRPSLRWLLIFVPLLPGLIIRFLSFGEQMIALEGMVADWLLAVGGIITAVSLGFAAVWLWQQRASAQAQTELHNEAVADHRRFMQRLDHELKNPLMAIRAAVANLRSGQGERDLSALGVVDAQAKRLSRLTADLRKVSEMDGRPLDMRKVDLDMLLRELFQLIEEREEAASRRLSLTLPEAPWPLPSIEGDWDLLYLALYNLLDNALKYSKAGSRIEVRGRENEGQVEIEVADTGVGIAPDALPHIWDELYRADRTRGISGSGLGLALTRAIIERHGGTVSAASRVGQGTSMQVELPIVL